MSSAQGAKGLNANLENFELTDVMQLITQQVKCGILTVEGTNGSCSWSFNDGSLVDFECNFPDLILDLTSILKQSYIINDQQLQSLKEKEDLNQLYAFEKALVKNNIISREELEKMNIRRLIESFIITLQWTSGRYKFIPTSEINIHPFVTPQDTNFIILEALRQIDEIAIMKKRLQPLGRIYETTLALNNDDDDNLLFQEGLRAQFNQDEFGIYKLMDGERSLGEILETSIIGQFHTCCTILDFLERGIITPSTGNPDYKPGKTYAITHNWHLTGIALIILSWALLISTFIAVKPNSKLRANPTLFSAIIDNLKADQHKMQIQAEKLLHNKNNSTR